MTLQSRTISNIALFLAALTMFVVTTTRARAENVVCVQCKNPNLTYRCNVLRGDGSPARAAYQFFCIKEIAREGNHESCSVKRNGTGICEGLEKTLVYGGPAPSTNPAMAGDPASGGDVASDGTLQAPNSNPENVGDGEPRTLIELTDQAAENTKKGLKKTGAAIGGAAKKTGNTVAGAVKTTGTAVGGAVKKTGKVVGGAVKNTGKVVGSAVKKTGKVVGSAAKSTLNCVTSLFTKCF